MGDRASRPHRIANRTPPHLFRQVVHLRRKKRLSPIQIGARLGIPASGMIERLVHHADAFARCYRLRKRDLSCPSPATPPTRPPRRVSSP